MRQKPSVGGDIPRAFASNGLLVGTNRGRRALTSVELSPSLTSRVAVGCQWITHRAAFPIQRPLRQPLLKGCGDAKT